MLWRLASVILRAYLSATVTPLDSVKYAPACASDTFFANFLLFLFLALLLVLVLLHSLGDGFRHKDDEAASSHTQTNFNHCDTL